MNCTPSSVPVPLKGSMDAGNMLKPMLARGELRLIGATTLNEYRENIEKDAALERRFQQVFVGEPSVPDTIGILRGLKERYEAHHKVAIADSALVAAATLSNRYITGRQLPDKAIDLVDEAASRLRMEIDSAPEEIDELRRAVDRLTMEELAISGETDEASLERLEVLREDMANKKEQLAALNARWEAEKAGLNRVGDIKARIDELRSLAEKAQRDGDLTEASRILYGEIPAMQKELDAAQEAEEDKYGDGARELMVSEEVTADDIAEVVSSWTGIPAGRMLQGESQKLLDMESVIGSRLIGQTQGSAAVADAVRRSRAGVSDPDRPTGSFLFLGPTGVGKTELAKALAEFIFDDERAMVRLDMSEYAEKHTVSRLVGAPPGYVGYEEGGQLTEAVRRRPYSVILLDEVEKAHPDVFDILLQVLDDGRLTDGQGRTVDFRNVILILTSNLGSQFLVDPGLTEEQKRESVMSMVNANFKPEFLNRLDDVILFDPLNLEELSEIVDLQVKALAHAPAGPPSYSGCHRRCAGMAGTDRLRPRLRRPSAAPSGPARDRRQAGQGNPGRTDIRTETPCWWTAGGHGRRTCRAGAERPGSSARRLGFLPDGPGSKEGRPAKRASLLCVLLRAGRSGTRSGLRRVPPQSSPLAGRRRPRSSAWGRRGSVPGPCTSRRHRCR